MNVACQRRDADRHHRLPELRLAGDRPRCVAARAGHRRHRRRLPRPRAAGRLRQRQPLQRDAGRADPADAGGRHGRRCSRIATRALRMAWRAGDEIWLLGEPGDDPRALAGSRAGLAARPCAAAGRALDLAAAARLVRLLPELAAGRHRQRRARLLGRRPGGGAGAHGHRRRARRARRRAGRRPPRPTAAAFGERAGRVLVGVRAGTGGGSAACRARGGRCVPPRSAWRAGMSSTCASAAPARGSRSRGWRRPGGPTSRSAATGGRSRRARRAPGSAPAGGPTPIEAMIGSSSSRTCARRRVRR